MFSEMALTKRDLQVFATDTNSHLTTTKQDLRSTVDHARDKIIDKLCEMHRNEISTLQCLYAQIDSLNKAMTANEMRMKYVERYVTELRSDQIRMLNTLRVFK